MSKIKKHKLKKATQVKTIKNSWWTKQKIWTFVLAGLMVFSVFGIILSADTLDQERQEYGEYAFKRARMGNEVVWKVNIDDAQYVFDYHPADVEAVEIDTELKDRLKSLRSTYVVFNPHSDGVEQFELARFKMQERLYVDHQVYAMNGILEEDDQYSQQVITCENATAYVPVIAFVEANDTAAYLDGDCIIVEANQYSVLAMKDRLLYAMLDIIE